MKKFLAALILMSASLFGMAVITPTADASVPTECSDARYVHKKYIGDEVTIYVRINYKTCKQGRRKWVRMISYQGKYVVKKGHTLTCNKFTSDFRAAHVNFYMWDNAGANHNPGTFILGCKRSGTFQRIFKAGTAPKLFWIDGWSPHWRATVKEELSTAYVGIPDNVKELSGLFNPKVD